MKKVIKPWAAMLLAGLFAAAFTAAAPAHAAGSPDKVSAPDSVASQDKDFFEKAALAGMTEVSLAQDAQTRAQSQDVRDFAAMMVTDHTKANEDLKALAARKGVTLPATLDDDHAGMVKDLRKADAKSYDKDYVKANVKAHEKAVSLFKDEAKKGKDADVKAFAQETLPTLQQHLDKIKMIQKNMK